MYDCIVASVGRSVIRKRMFLYSISEGAGRMLLDLMFALFALITLVRKKIRCRLFQILWRRAAFFWRCLEVLLATEWCRLMAIPRGGWHLPQNGETDLTDLYGWVRSWLLQIYICYIYIYILLYVNFVSIKKGSYQILYTVLQTHYIHSTGTHALWLFVERNWMIKCLPRMELVKEGTAWVQLHGRMGQEGLLSSFLHLCWWTPILILMKTTARMAWALSSRTSDWVPLKWKGNNDDGGDGGSGVDDCGGDGDDGGGGSSHSNRRQRSHWGPHSLSCLHFTPSQVQSPTIHALTHNNSHVYRHTMQAFFIFFAYLMWYCALQNSPEPFSSSISV